MKLLDPSHPFFAPRWRRIAVVTVCVLWAGMEWLTHSPVWAMLASGLAVYTGYTLLLTFDPARAAPSEPKE